MEFTANRLEAIVDRPILYVDFNEYVTEDTVMLSQSDIKKDINQTDITLTEGLRVLVYMNDLNEENQRDDLFALGIVTKNGTELYPHVKWLVKLEGNEVRHVGEFTF